MADRGKNCEGTGRLTQHTDTQAWDFKYNQKSDMWAVGCLVYELVTGASPFNWVSGKVDEIVKELKTRDRQAVKDEQKDEGQLLDACSNMAELRQRMKFLLSGCKVFLNGNKDNVHGRRSEELVNFVGMPPLFFPLFLFLLFVWGLLLIWQTVRGDNNKRTHATTRHPHTYPTGACLKENSDDRPTCAELLKFPFLQRYNNSDDDKRLDVEVCLCSSVPPSPLTPPPPHVHCNHPQGFYGELQS